MSASTATFARGTEESADRSRRFVAPAGSPLPANLAALRASDATLAEAIEAELEDAGYAVEASRCGAATAALTGGQGRRVYLHSRHHPVEEARRLVESVEAETKTVVCVHGFGLGYHVEALFERVGPETVIVVFEPDVKLLRTALEHRDFSKLISSKRVNFLTAAERSGLMLRLHDQQAMVCVGLASVEHGPSVQLHPEFHRRAKELVGEFQSYCRTSIQTLILSGRKTAENIARNLEWYVGAPGINELKDRHAGRPAVIVSAGPSLRKNKHLLSQAAGKATMIAVQTTLRPLLEMGIEPDYVTSLDWSEICTRFFENLPKDLKTHLVAEPKASSAVLKLFPGSLSILGNDYADRLVGGLSSSLKKDRLRAGATVAHLAFYLAEYMGCDPIIFVGQDLGFSDGLAYAPGTSYEDVWRPELSRFCSVEMKQWEHIARERPILRRIEGQDGGSMYTEERLFAYLQQFERDFATTRARVIDATEGGALKRGAEVMTLAEALGRYCGADLAPVMRTRAMSPCHPMACRDELVKRRAEAEGIARLGTQTLEVLKQVKEKLADQAAVNRLIGRIDVLRAEMRRFDDCYELVMQLSQKTEFERFRNDRLLAASRAQGEERQRRQLERDIANVSAVIDAAGEFVGLMDEVIELMGGMASRRAAQEAA